MATLYQQGKVTKDFDGEKALTSAADALRAATRSGDKTAVSAAKKAYEDAEKKSDSARQEALKVKPKSTALADAEAKIKELEEKLKKGK